MEFERLPEDSEHECQILFDTEEEQEVIRAVYTEHIAGLAKTGNIGSISAFDREMSDYAEGDEEASYRKFISTDDLIVMIQTFHDNTETAATEIALESGRPSYENWYIAERLELGERALELIRDLQEEAVIGEAIRGLDEMTESDPRINP
jgi:hypothetical protein